MSFHRWYVPAFVAAWLAVSPALRAADPVVETTSGPVRGAALDGVDVFLGIPYAAPPTGSLRWKPPQPPAPWSEPLDARDWPPPCPQLDDDGRVVGDEDCLALNVWSPHHQTTVLLPVMVFIHGGGNTFGSTSEVAMGTRLYDGADLARRRGVVVVTVQYRLGALGFLAHPAFAAEDPHGSTGNYGLLDQQAALGWVQDNIWRFGGDPDKVLLFGESAGATDTLMQLVSPLARGLFAAAILESGGDVAAPRTDQYHQAADIAEVVGCGDAADPAGCLRAISVDELVRAPEELGYPGTLENGLARPHFKPTIDGWVIPAEPSRLVEAGLAARVPVILGANADETLPWAPELGEAAYEALLRSMLAPWGPDVVQQALDLYAVGPEGFASPREAWAALTTDMQFVCPVRRRARALAADHSAPVYLYLFEQGFGGPLLGPFGAFHGAELWYVFQHVEDIPGYQPSPGQLALEEAMGSYWSHLALAGSPSSLEYPPWPLVSPGGGPWLILGDGITIVSDARADRCRFWDRVSATPPTAPRRSSRPARR